MLRTALAALVASNAHDEGSASSRAILRALVANVAASSGPALSVVPHSRSMSSRPSAFAGY